VGRAEVAEGRDDPVGSTRLLPDVPAEETDVGWGEPPDRSDEDRLFADRPPHHLP
jgi:hypothetical protein